MRMFIHGTDKGNAVLIALVSIIILSTIVVTLTPRIIATKKYSQDFKTKVIRTIEESNKEIIIHYDLH